MGKMKLDDVEKAQLLALGRSQTVRSGDARRAKLILMLEDGESRDTIMLKLGCDSRFIARWSGRFLEERLAGLYARHPGREPQQPVEKLEARVLNHTLKRKPADGSTHWSSYKLAAALGDVSVSAVQRIWRKHNLQPQRLEQHMVSNHPLTQRYFASMRRPRSRHWIARTGCYRCRQDAPKATASNTSATAR